MMEYFVLLKERAQKLDSFLLDVIDYARNSQTGVRMEAVDIEQLVDSVLDNFTFVKGADKIRFEKQAKFTHKLETDRVRLMVILNNILSNAVKYHRLDTNRDPWIKLEAAFADSSLDIVIADNGQGIDADLLPKIFNMFFRGTNQSKGSGLGLYIVKETVEKMNGTITAISELDSGTTFKISIPSRVSTIAVQEKVATTIL
jgi:signal transduction histidine kinase